MEDNELSLFNDVYREIGCELGLDVALKVYQLFKGQQISFPVHLFDSKRIHHAILEEFDGENARELARRYGYSEKTIRRVLKASKKL